MSSSEFEADTSNRRQARENACAEGTINIVFALLLIGWESGVSFVNQSQSAVEENKSKRISLLTLNWRTLYKNVFYLSFFAANFESPKVEWLSRMHGRDVGCHRPSLYN